MINVRMSVLVVAAALLAGCAAKTMTRTGCEESTQTFEALESCLKVAADRLYTPRPQYTPELGIYLAKAGYLSDRVKANLISEFNARAELQRNYVVMLEQKAAK
jgi:hypothetical protein